MSAGISKFSLGPSVELASRPAQWDAYVDSLAPDRLYHRWVWREVIEQSFGHQAFYLVARAEGAICGVLPLFHMQSRLFGNFMVSIPFFSYGGLLASSAEAADALLARAVELARELGARHIELRQGDPGPISWRGLTPKVTMELVLPHSTEEFWKSLSSGMRNKVRQAERHGLSAEWGGREALPVFYRIFAANMRNLGTPVYPRKFFANQLERLPGRIRILTMLEGGRPVAAAFLTAHGDVLELPWSASLPNARKKYSHVLMYWTFIQKAIAEGFRRIDLGRCSVGSGTWEFKRHWNPLERPLHWYYWLAPGQSLPQLNADNPRFSLATRAWKQLPLWVANRLGPPLVRSIP